jgi:hypothetical protein
VQIGDVDIAAHKKAAAGPSSGGPLARHSPVVPTTRLSKLYAMPRSQGGKVLFSVRFPESLRLNRLEKGFL